MTSSETRHTRPGPGVRTGLALALLAAATPGITQESFRVIVNAELKGDAITRSQLSALFLEGAGRWGSTDHRVAVVDQSLASPVRAAFSREVLEMEPRAVLFYWNRRVRERRGRPPKVKGSDADVVEFVASKAGGIGYVSNAIELPPSVKVMKIVNY